jgi:hypothetical protein
LQLGEVEQAEQLCRQTLDLRLDPAVYGPEHPETLRSIHQLVRILAAKQRWDESDAELEKLIETAQRTLLAGHFLTASFRLDLGLSWLRRQRLDAAEKELLESQRELNAALGPRHPRRIAALRALVELYDRQKNDASAAAWREKLREATTG